MNARVNAALALSYFLVDVSRPLRMPLEDLSLEELWSRPDNVLARLLALQPAERRRLAHFRRHFDAGEKLKRLRAAGVGVLVLGERGYPASLAAIYDPPPVLYWLSRPGGRMQDFMACPRIAIVGSRAASPYGIEVAGALAEALAEAGVCVVSGMAMGIDAAAHRGAIPGPGGSIAVLGCGIDMAYPRRHKRLYGELQENGAVMSEYPPGIPPLPWRFPARNRIIAGLSRGVIVVEAGGKSGALITADFALEQGREVYAVPGGIFSPLSRGPNRLIRAGAVPVTAISDILEDLGLPQVPTDRRSADNDLNDAEKCVFRELDSDCRHPDQIVARTGLASQVVVAALVALELKGLAGNQPGGGYFRRR